MSTTARPDEGPHIVWRNPESVKRRQRWEALKQDSDFTVYLIQQFVCVGEHGFWYAASSLEFVRGGRSRVAPTHRLLSVDIQQRRVPR